MQNSAKSLSPWRFAVHLLAWGTVTLALAFLVEVYLMFWRGQEGARAFLQGDMNGLLAALCYVVALALAVVLAIRGQAENSFRPDSARISALTAYIARAAFWTVLLVGVADAAISFLRIEGLLPALVGDDLATQLGQPRWRGAVIHTPLIVLGFVVAAFTRDLGFIWLALLVVVTQLALVIGRFIFSYEQAFMSDLVRMWYAALFLFASAYTLIEEGHVRVDVFFASMSRKGQALVNGLGSVVLGMTFCWTILILGMATSASTIVGPFLSYEQGQQGFGMMTKYLLAVYLGVFAITMLFQFAAYVLKAAADWNHEHDPDAKHDDHAHAVLE